ncbi:MAG TPA: FUSC family protein [Streptosporangiaceae bacterium]|nr:FUSC family protein [Streptosporangiaceae bacterium]
MPGRLAADVRAGRSYVAGELRRPGWLDFGAFRWRDLAIGRGARAALGVVTPLAIGIAIGRTADGSFAALGALPAGFVSFRGVNRTRVLAVALAAAGMAVSTFVGATAAYGVPWLLVPIVFAWAYAAGLLAALGPTALVVTLQWPVALLIATALPLGPAGAAERAALVLAGGLWQGLLVVTSWAVARGSAERSALAQAFLGLARYAADVAAGSQEPAPPDTWAGQTALRDPNPLIRSAARMHMLDLNAEVDRIRGTLTALGIGRESGRPGSRGRSLLSSAQLILSEIAAALTARPGQRAEHLATARRELAETEPEPGTRWEWAGDALLGQLRGAVRITERLNDAEPASSAWAKPQPASLAQLHDMMLTLRASLGTSTESGRHALRLAVVAAIAEVIARAADLPHGYWVVLTVFIVLRPDYSSTIYRGLQRAAGTVVGAGLGVLTVMLAHVGPAVLLCGIAVSLLAAYAVFTVNYLLYAVFLTDFVVVLLALLGLPPVPTALDRLIGTGVGTGLAMLAYLLWPTWEGISATDKFARLFELQGRYAAALLRAYARPDTSALARITGLQLATRRARIEADASADRLAGEPDHPPMTGELARELESAAHRDTQATLALRAALAVHHAGQPGATDASLQPRLDQLAAEVETATGLIARTLRALGAEEGAAAGLDAVPPLPQLQSLRPSGWLPPGADQAEPRASIESDPKTVTSGGETVSAADDTGEAAGLFTAVDGLVDAINTAGYTLRHQEG